MAVSNLDSVYRTMQKWMESMPNVESVAVILVAEGMRMQITWLDKVAYTYLIPKSALETESLDVFGDMIFSEAERQYKLFTVGEE